MHTVYNDTYLYNTGKIYLCVIIIEKNLILAIL